MDLFDRGEPSGPRPLPDRLRPQSLDEIVGQGHVLGAGSFLRIAIEQDAVPSLILWGVPGCGKTTLARVIADATDAAFEPFSAVLGGVKEIRQIVDRARQRRQLNNTRTLLFVDEIHRFNKSQQDAFLPHVEDGTLTLIGATTENPSFALNAALLSRARVVRLEPLGVEDLVKVLQRGLEDEKRGLGHLDVTVEDGVLEVLARAADGDGRRALGLLEEVVLHGVRTGVDVSKEVAHEALAHSPLRHSRKGDEHYDLVSAFIKSMRGSDPDAALYYMARLLEAGDDPLFICRRLIIFASEDVGNADPRALGVAVDGMNAFRVVGMPEGRIMLGQVCTYLATAPKSNASYKAFDAARDFVKETGSLPVPDRLRNAPTALAKDLGHGEGYRYPHDHGGWVPDHYLPESIEGMVFYEPTEQGYERHLRERVDRWRGERRSARGKQDERG